MGAGCNGGSGGGDDDGPRGGEGASGDRGRKTGVGWGPDVAGKGVREWDKWATTCRALHRDQEMVSEGGMGGGVDGGGEDTRGQIRLRMSSLEPPSTTTSFIRRG